MSVLAFKVKLNCQMFYKFFAYCKMPQANSMFAFYTRKHNTFTTWVFLFVYPKKRRLLYSSCQFVSLVMVPLSSSSHPLTHSIQPFFLMAIFLNIGNTFNLASSVLLMEILRKKIKLNCPKNFALTYSLPLNYF